MTTPIGWLRLASLHPNPTLRLLSNTLVHHCPLPTIDPIPLQASCSGRQQTNLHFDLDYPLLASGSSTSFLFVSSSPIPPRQDPYYGHEQTANSGKILPPYHPSTYAQVIIIDTNAPEDFAPEATDSSTVSCS